MDSPAQYFQWGFIQISLANLIVIGLMLVVFALAVVIRRREKSRSSTIENPPPAKEKRVDKKEVGI